MCYGAGDQKTSEVHAASRSRHPVLPGEALPPTVLTRRRVDKEQAQPSAIAPSHRETDHAIGSTMIDIGQPFNADALQAMARCCRVRLSVWQKIETAARTGGYPLLETMNSGQRR
jgi:hypothetical protein